MAPCKSPLHAGHRVCGYWRRGCRKVFSKTLAAFNSNIKESIVLLIPLKEIFCPQDMIGLSRANLGIFLLRMFGVVCVYIDLPGVVFWQHIHPSTLHLYWKEGWQDSSCLRAWPENNRVHEFFWYIYMRPGAILIRNSLLPNICKHSLSTFPREFYSKFCFQPMCVLDPNRSELIRDSTLQIIICWALI